MYEDGDLHPLDLKNGVADCLVNILEPVRNYLKENSA
jgi:tyrosyl-tRNA synthetase